MDLSIKYNYTNTPFNARLSNDAKARMDSVLTELLKNNKIDLNGLVKKSGYSEHFIHGWFSLKFGLTPKQYFAEKQQKTLDNEFIKLYGEGLTIKQLAEYFSKSVKWVNSMLDKFKLLPHEYKLNADFENNVMSLLNKGYTVNVIAKKLNSSAARVKNVIKNNYNENAVQYRNRNNIKLNHETKMKKKQKMIEKHFSEGKGIKETAKLVGLSKNTLFRFKDEYDAKTILDRGHELMEMFLQDMIQAGDNIKTMARLFGLSEATVSRRIKTLYGKNYKDLTKV